MAALVVYNEETFLEQSIQNLFKISDLDAIEILDGAWNSGGKTPKSTDRTKNIVQDAQKQSRIPIIFTENDYFWESEPAKRNWQLEYLEKKYGPDTWVFWFDGDEEIRFHSGINNIKMEPILRDKKKCGIVTTYGFGYDIAYPGVRFFPLGHRIHFYSEMANHLHDKDCNTIMDWSTGKQSQPCWYMDKFFIVNRWMVRNGVRFQDKIDYFKFQVQQAEKTKNYPPCIFQSSLITKPIHKT